MIVEIQVLPTPSGTAEERYAHVNAAIAEIRESGLVFEVGPLGTSVEGSADELWPLLRQVHEATLRAGATSVVSVIKVAERAANDDELTMGSLTKKHRS